MCQCEDRPCCGCDEDTSRGMDKYDWLDIMDDYDYEQDNEWESE